MYQRVSLFLILALAATMLGPSHAHASTLGDSIESFLQSLNDTPQLVKTVAYVMGVAMGVWAMFKIKDHVDNPMQTPLRAGILRLIGGGMLLSLPMVTEALFNTFDSGNGAFALATARKSPALGGSMSLDEVMVSLMQDIGPHMENFIQAFCYVFALIFTVVGAIRLTKHQQEGPRGPSGMGTLTTFVVAGALFSLANMMGAFTQSLFGADDAFAYATLSFTGVSATAQTHIEIVTESVLGFMMLLGWISFARGWFILKAVADGGGQASLMSGITHIVGGALAVNLGHLINAVQETLGLTPFGITMS